jgi:K+-transporting ATPase ATPase A chain
MSPLDWIQIIAYITLLIITVPVLGTYMANVVQGKYSAQFLFSHLETWSYRLANINPQIEMSWKRYTCTLILFNFFGFLILFNMLIFQSYLPLNPQNFKDLSWDLAFNIAASFVTNTNWQSYGGEQTLSYFSQMTGLGVQNFLSAATGGAVLLALIRGLTRRSLHVIGNFWVDLVRLVIYIFLPLSFIFAIFLISQGVIQNLSPYVEVETLEQAKQILPMGPVASQVAIKQIGTNGGGFFNANSAHPFENPTPFSNFLEMFAIICLPAAFTYTYGILIGSKRHGWILFNVMLFVWAIGLGISLYSQNLFNPVLQSANVLEGIETRFGTNNSLIWSTATTATGNGSVNAMLESLSPLAGGVAMFNILLGENIFGGIGVGMSGMIMFVLLTVFLSGLMVGRTPEYLGKKIENRTIKWVMIALLVPICTVLGGASLAIVIPQALSSISSKGPHAFSELLYTFTSASGNNGSAFAGINANTPFYNIVLGMIMIIARLAILVPSLAIAGDLVQKRITPPSAGTLGTDNILFAMLLFCVILIIGALTFFPALALGPIVEHVLMLNGQSF